MDQLKHGRSLNNDREVEEVVAGRFKKERGIGN